jgi:hypothetical protein
MQVRPIAVAVAPAVHVEQPVRVHSRRFAVQFRIHPNSECPERRIRICARVTIARQTKSAQDKAEA